MWRAVRNRLYRAAGEKIIDVETENIKEILVICTGNTCRSPMAEGLLRNRKNDIIVSSAGLFADGSAVSQNAVTVMKEKGIDISGHHSRQISKEQVAEADLILTMTKNHKQMLVNIFPEFEEKIITLSQWALTQEDVNDPYGGTEEDYRNCRNQLEMLIEKGCRENL